MTYGPVLTRSGDRGAAALIVAISMLVLMGFAALVVDVGAGFNERAQDQSAADAGSMAGVLDLVLSDGDATAVADTALAYVASNLDTALAPAAWQLAWQTCTDSTRPPLNAAGEPFHWVPVPDPWSGSPATLDCISIDWSGYVRVRVPDQLVPTTFGRLLGSAGLTTYAGAIGQSNPLGVGGILPFGLLGNASAGALTCLKDNSQQPLPPCDGGDTGNYGQLESPIIGGRKVSIPEGTFITNSSCGSGPQAKKDLLALNISLGVDHLLVEHDAQSDYDVCPSNNNPPYTGVPDYLNTFQGMGQGTEEGLIAGGITSYVSPDPPPRLNIGSDGSYINVFGSPPANDTPLWTYIDTTLHYPDIPESCDAAIEPFNVTNVNLYDYVYDLGPPLLSSTGSSVSWQHLGVCLQDYVQGNYSAQLFLDTIAQNPRFAFVPQFEENTWPPGNSDWRHIREFRAVFLQSLWFGTGKANKVRAFNPGEPCVRADGSGCGYGDNHAGALRQLAGFFLPNSTLSSKVRGTSPGNPGITPWGIALYQ